MVGSRERLGGGRRGERSSGQRGGRVWRRDGKVGKGGMKGMEGEGGERRRHGSLCVVLTVPQTPHVSGGEEREERTRLSLLLFI